MIWIRRAIWFVAIAGWIVVILAGLVTDQSAGKVTACVIGAILTWIAVFMMIGWYFGIRRRVKRHLRMHPRNADQLEHHITAGARVDMLRALQRLYEETRGQQIGFQTAYANLQDRVLANPEPVNLEWESYQTGADEWADVASNACYFLTFNDVPFIATVINDTPYRYQYNYGEAVEDVSADARIKLAILTPDRESCRDVRDYLISCSRQFSVYRGRQLLCRPGDSGKDPVRVDFTEVATVDRSAIILPQRIFDVIDRAAIRQMDLGDVLQQAGHRTRTALLLHGPPGTGKTLLTRYITGLRSDTTTIMLHGFRRGLVREAFRLARYCQPSFVVIEDVDLIAIRRQKNSRGTSALHELLDELDGLAPESRTVIVMTSNRPDVLEPALASRPGRVSQAIEVNLPDAANRLRILELFTAKTNADDVDFDSWVQCTDGASPAFLEELVRRAILFAAEAQTQEPGSNPSKIKLTNEHLSSAINEILSSGGVLTQKLLGYADS